MNQTNQTTDLSSKNSSIFRVSMRDGTVKTIDLATIPTTKRVRLSGDVDGQHVNCLTLHGIEGSDNVIASTTGAPNQGILLSTKELTAIVQNGDKIRAFLRKHDGGQTWG